MSRAVYACSPIQSLHTPAKLMDDHGVSCVVVVDAGKVVGTITDREICMGAMRTSAPLWGTPVRKSMSPGSAIGAGVSVDEALGVMDSRGVRFLAVVDGAGALVGIVSRDDLAPHAAGSRNVTSVPWPGSLSISS